MAEKTTTTKTAKTAETFGGLAKSATYVVALPDREVTFETDDSGSYTPKDDHERRALRSLGARLKED